MDHITIGYCLDLELLSVVLQLLKPIILGFQAFIVPICFVSAWLIVLLTAWSLWSTIRDTATRTRQLHQIPCANCQYFTSSYHLKCTVHPAIALTEDAIDCLDYASKDITYTFTTSNSHSPNP